MEMSTSNVSAQNPDRDARSAQQGGKQLENSMQVYST